MGIRYIIGRSGTGKTHYIFNEINEQIKQPDDSNLILIVPEQFTLQAERNLIEKLNLPGIMGVEVLSFTRLAHHVLNETGGLKRIHMNEQGKQMVLRKLIDEIGNDLTIYHNAFKQSGFVSMVSRLLSELKQYDILPQDLIDQADHLQHTPILNNKLKDIARIYHQFNEHLQGTYLDSEDYINLLIEKIGQSSFLHQAKIWIDNFYSFTPQMYRILEKLVLAAKEITLTFTMEIPHQEKDGDLFKAANLHYNRMRMMAEKNGFSEEMIELRDLYKNEIEKSAEIKHLEQEFYAYPYQPYRDEVNNLELFNGLNLQAEVEHMASRIVSLVRDQGYRFKDVAVVCNDLDQYGPLVKRVLDEYRIPYFLDQKRSIMHNPIIEFILASLEVIEKGYRYEHLFRMVKTGFSRISIDDCEKLENYALRYGIQGEKWKNAFTIGDEFNVTELNFIRQQLLNPLLKLEKRIKGKKTVEEMTKALYSYLENVELPDQLEKWIDRLREEECYQYVNEYTQIWNTVVGIFDQLVELIGEQKLHLKEYIRILESGFLSIEIGVIPTTIDQVLIGNMQRSKSNDIKALFVLGVNDGILPSIGAEEGILSDEERIFLEQRGISLGLDSEKKAYEEKFMIYSSLTKPSQFLFISYALADQEGKALRPSMLIDRFKKIFPRLKVQSNLHVEPEMELERISTPNSTFKQLVEKLRIYLDGQPIDELWWDVFKWYDGRKEWTEKKKAIIDGLFHKNQVAALDGNTAKRLYTTPIRASVSRIEQFINCPFAHFVKYGLRPKERRMFKVEAPDIGDLFHKSLEIFTGELREHRLNWEDLDKGKAEEIIDRVIDQLVPVHENGMLLSTHRYRHLVRRLKRISKRAVWTLTEHLKRGGFKPLGYEMAFGMNQEFPAIEVELLNGEKMVLEGRIDRVDILETDQDTGYVRIIDYKSGNKDFYLSDVYFGLQLQLMVYLDAVISNKDKMNKKELHPGGIFYFKIDDPLVQSREQVVEEIEKEIRRKLKMKGLVLKDVKIVREMDREIGGYSEIIPVGLKNDDQFYEKSSALDVEKFYSLMDHVRHIVREIGYEILNGNIRIEPYKNGKQTACQYCSYQSVCQFDSQFNENTYKQLKKLSDGEIINQLTLLKGGETNGKLD